METAAVALLLGWADPLELLALDVEDLRLADAILRKAQKLQADQQTALADYVATKTAAVLMKPLGKLLGSHAKAIIRGLTPKGK